MGNNNLGEFGNVGSLLYNPKSQRKRLDVWCQQNEISNPVMFQNYLLLLLYQPMVM